MLHGAECRAMNRVYKQKMRVVETTVGNMRNVNIEEKVRVARRDQVVMDMNLGDQIMPQLSIVRH